jgi:hypothetical protein
MYQPHLEVLDRVAVLVLGGTLPRNDVGTFGREAYFEDIFGGKGGDDDARVSVDDVDPVVKLVPCGPGCFGPEKTYFSGYAHAKYRPQGE